MQFDVNRALYLQIADELRQRIIEGKLSPGERIPPVRQLAADLGVTPNTLQRAFQELERQGLLYTDRTSGRFVTNDVLVIQALRQESEEKLVRNFVQNLMQMGLEPREILHLVQMQIQKEIDPSDDK